MANEVARFKCAYVYGLLHHSQGDYFVLFYSGHEKCAIEIYFTD